MIIIDAAVLQNEEFEQDDMKKYSLNTYHCPDFLKYLKVNVFPYYPMVSHAVFCALGLDIIDDTTNVSESNHSIIKNQVHQGKARHRISRFFRRQLPFLQGAIFSLLVYFCIYLIQLLFCRSSSGA